MAQVKRRDFLKIIGAAASTAAASPKFLVTSPAFGQGTENRCLVNIFGGGGFDGCQMFIDHSNGAFMDAFNSRRQGSLVWGPANANRSLSIGNTNIKLHWRLPFVASQYAAGKVALLGSVGVAQSNSGSHEIATDDWARGLSDGSFRNQSSPFTQVLAERFLSNRANNVIRHAILERVGSKVFSGQAGLSVNSLSGYGFSTTINNATSGFMLDTAFAVMSQSNLKPEQLPIKQAWTEIERSVASVAQAMASTTINPAFPNTGIGASLRDIFVAIMNYEVRIAWASFGSNDRHGDLDRDTQTEATPADQSLIWRNLNDALQAFYANLDRVGKSHLVTTAVQTEFGRTSAVNATNGTDHGKATNTFVMGGWINGGIYGAPPDLNDMTGPRNRIETKLPLGNVIADLLNGLKINGNTPISPQLFAWPHQTSIGLST